MVEGGPDQAHRPGQVRENLIPNNNRTGPAEPSLEPPLRAGCFNVAHPRIAAARTWLERLAFQRPVGYLESFPYVFHKGRK